MYGDCGGGSSRRLRSNPDRPCGLLDPCASKGACTGLRGPLVQQCTGGYPVESPRAAAPAMVATGKGKDRYRATTRKLLLMPRQVHAPGWVVSPGWQGPAVERRQAAAVDGAWPVSTAVPGVQRAPGPVWVSRVRNVETLLWVCIPGAGMRRRCGKPTVRGAEFPGRTGCPKSGCRAAERQQESGAAGPGT